MFLLFHTVVMKDRWHLVRCQLLETSDSNGAYGQTFLKPLSATSLVTITNTDCVLVQDKHLLYTETQQWVMEESVKLAYLRGKTTCFISDWNGSYFTLSRDPPLNVDNSNAVIAPCIPDGCFAGLCWYALLSVRVCKHCMNFLLLSSHFLHKSLDRIFFAEWMMVKKSYGYYKNVAGCWGRYAEMSHQRNNVARGRRQYLPKNVE